MAPDRILLGGEHPARRAAYVMIFMAVAIIALAVWVILLSGRVSDAEAIRRSDQRNAKARTIQSCRYLDSLVEVSINIPVRNLNDILMGELTQEERSKREDAKQRYLDQLETFKPAIKACIPILEEAR